MLKNRNILVADDNPAMRFVISESLRRAGAGVQEAASGTEALKLAQHLQPDLILMDVQMPGMSGIEVCVALRSAAYSSPILAFCDADERLGYQCLASGMNAVLPKTCSRDLLLEQIARYIGSNRRSASSAPCFSHSAFLEFCDGDEAFMRRLLAIAAQVLPKSAKEIRTTAAGGHLPQLAAAAHRVRSSVEGLGLASLAGSLRQLEYLAGTGAQGLPDLYLLAQKTARGLEQAAREITLHPFCLQKTEAVFE